MRLQKFTIIGIFGLLNIAACGDLPVEPVEEVADEWPLWCDPATYQIEGQWGREFASRGHHFRTAISITATEPCEFAYTVMVIQQANADHEERRIHLSVGTVVATAFEQSGPVGILTIETQRARQENRRPDGEWMVDESPQVFDTQKAKLWGESLAIWSHVYQRKESP